MEIEEVKLWQWMLAGLIAGLLFSCIIVYNGPRFDTQSRDTIEQGEFENDLYLLTEFRRISEISPLSRSYAQVQYNIDRSIKDGEKAPRVRNLIVHPPLRDDPQHRYWVTGEFFVVGREAVDPSKPGSGQKPFSEWKAFKYGAPVPYQPGYAEHEAKKRAGSPEMNAMLAKLRLALGDKTSFPTVVDYLNAVSKLPNAGLTFKTTWWEQPKMIWSLPPLAGFLVIGVAWPLALSILQGIGVAKPAPVKVAPKPIAKPEPVRTPSTAGVKMIPTAPAAPPPISAEAKKYGGEFYPVAKKLGDTPVDKVAVKPKSPPTVTKTK